MSMPWIGLDGADSGRPVAVALYNYCPQEQQQQHLRLVVGDKLALVSQYTNWYYGHLWSDSSKKGVFPQEPRFVSLRPPSPHQRPANLRTFAGRCRTSRQAAELFRELREMAQHLESAAVATRKLDSGNQAYGFDTVMRNSRFEEVANPFEFSFVGAFKHMDETAKTVMITPAPDARLTVGDLGFQATPAGPLRVRLPGDPLEITLTLRRSYNPHPEAPPPGSPSPLSRRPPPAPPVVEHPHRRYLPPRQAGPAEDYTAPHRWHIIGSGRGSGSGHAGGSSGGSALISQAFRRGHIRPEPGAGQHRGAAERTSGTAVWPLRVQPGGLRARQPLLQPCPLTRPMRRQALVVAGGSNSLRAAGAPSKRKEFGLPATCHRRTRAGPATKHSEPNVELAARQVCDKAGKPGSPESLATTGCPCTTATSASCASQQSQSGDEYRSVIFYYHNGHHRAGTKLIRLHLDTIIDDNLASHHVRFEIRHRSCQGARETRRPIGYSVLFLHNTFHQEMLKRHALSAEGRRVQADRPTCSSRRDSRATRRPGATARPDWLQPGPVQHGASAPIWRPVSSSPARHSSDWKLCRGSTMHFSQDAPAGRTRRVLPPPPRCGARPPPPTLGWQASAFGPSGTLLCLLAPYSTAAPARSWSRPGRPEAGRSAAGPVHEPVLRHLAEGLKADFKGKESASGGPATAAWQRDPSHRLYQATRSLLRIAGALSCDCDLSDCSSPSTQVLEPPAGCGDQLLRLINSVTGGGRPRCPRTACSSFDRHRAQAADSKRTAQSQHVRRWCSAPFNELLGHPEPTGTRPLGPGVQACLWIDSAIFAGSHFYLPNDSSPTVNADDLVAQVRAGRPDQRELPAAAHWRPLDEVATTCKLLESRIILRSLTVIQEQLLYLFAKPLQLNVVESFLYCVFAFLRQPHLIYETFPTDKKEHHVRLMEGCDPRLAAFELVKRAWSSLAPADQLKLAMPLITLLLQVSLQRQEQAEGASGAFMLVELLRCEFSQEKSIFWTKEITFVMDKLVEEFGSKEYVENFSQYFSDALAKEGKFIQNGFMFQSEMRRPDGPAAGSSKTPHRRRAARENRMFSHL
uniref:SH3 domain-containing protein n=1 Tax=Macrostomum lignano TaxID=282301 RepID=A0A1I8F9H9_9PLAT